VHHGEPISHQSPSSIPYARSHIDTNTDASYLGNIDTEGLLNDVSGLNKQGCIQNDANMYNVGDLMVVEYDEFDDEPGFNYVRSKGGQCEDVAYRRLLE